MSEDKIPFKQRKVENKKIIPILNRKYTDTNIPLVKFHVLKISNKKLLSKLLLNFPKLPEEYEHLKRIRNGCEFLIEPLTGDGLLSQRCTEVIEEIFKNDEKFEMEIVEVPSIMPLSKLQKEAVRECWPVKCKRIKEVDDTINENIFNEYEAKRIIELFEEVELSNGVIIYDPKNDKVIIKIDNYEKEHILDHPVRRAIDKLSELQSNTSSCEQYLATGYYIILGEEICAMCSMALVHSRANKVFFGKPLPSKGVLISNWRIMEEPKINHHYSLFMIQSQYTRETNFRWKLKVNENFNITSYEKNKIINMNYKKFMVNVNEIVDKLKSFNNCIIGINIERGIKLVVAIVGVLISGNAFVILEENNSNTVIKRMIERFKINALLTKSGLEVFNFKELEWKEKKNIIMYVIQSSGTTGDPKIIHVPFSCILPNIEYFYENLKLTNNDIIMCSTSFSFDPSIIELFLPIIYGCKLILVQDNFRKQPSLLCDVIINEKITFFQTTPSFLKLLSKNILLKVLSSNIKHLLIGGEEFPYFYLKNIIISTNYVPNNLLKIYNVYGITEVSCWAMIKEIKLESLINYKLSFTKYKDIAEMFGRLIFSTSIQITSSGKILIGGYRQYSGDLYIDGKFVGRKKNNGMLRDYEIENICYSKWIEVENCKLIYDDNNFFVLFIKLSRDDDELFSNIKKYIYSEIKKDFLPNDIVKFNDIWPINKNGKVDENELLNWYKKNLKLNLSFLSTNSSYLSKTLREMGIDSFKAIEINYHIQSHFPKKFPYFLQYLLNPTTTVNSLLQFLKYHKINFSLEETISHDNKGENLLSNLTTCFNKISSNILWSINMKKCIDSNVIIFNECHNEFFNKDIYYVKDNFKTIELCMVGSHSGLFVLVDINSGSIIYEYEAEGRIEGTCSDVFIYNNNIKKLYLVAVPTYAGEIILIDIKDLKVIKVFKIKAIIKCKPVFTNNGYLWIAGYDKIIYTINLNILNMETLYNIDGLPLAEPLIVDDKIIFSLLSGTIYCFNTFNMTLTWKITNSTYPSFSKPTLLNIEGKEHFIITSPEGFISVFNVNDGKKNCQFKIDEEIFDSAFIKDKKIIVSSKKGNIYIFKFTKNDIFLVEKKPILSELNVVKNIKPLNGMFLGVTTDGKIWFIDEGLNNKECIFDTKAEVFSFPAIIVKNNNEIILIFGARDNLLRCICIK
ncbi:Acyl-CoA synthetase family member 4 [Strongyloides ratti]|uniref:Acyl-CoA synthetase family member 4 n=1 Tax=Strongyloides ratti TaxID=34506 RepID=A0A090LIY6_STRRB|nr:Acyl-CoA synthetase family member 4 [Strongyloides ratti]CEF68098.1 Acyl-CoA synthetase family member 4 [Strongyloides ratti]